MFTLRSTKTNIDPLLKCYSPAKDSRNLAITRVPNLQLHTSPADIFFRLQQCRDSATE